MSTNPCVCSWHDCDALHVSIREIAPSSHAWCQNNIRITFASCDLRQLSLKKYALRQAIFKHISMRQLSINYSQKNIFIAPHHFPLCLLEWREKHNVKAFTKLLSVSDVSNMEDTDNGRQLLKERCNSATQLMRNHHSYDSTKFKNMFVQSPLNTRSSVTIFIASYRRRVVNRVVNVTNTQIPRTSNGFRSGPLISSIDPIRLDFASPASIIDISGLTTAQNAPSAPSSSPPSSPSIIMTVKECHSLLDSKLKDADNEPSIFENKQSTKSIAKLLVKYHENFEKYELSNKMYFYPCVGTTLHKTSLCSYFVLRYRTQQSTSNALCKHCYSFKQDDDRKIKRSLKESKRLKPISSNPSSLPILTDLRTKTRKKLYYLKSKNSILQNLLETKKEKLCIRRGDVRDVLLQAINYVNSNLKESKDQLIKIFLSLQFTNNPGEATFSEQDDYCNYVLESINNMGKKLARQDSQCRYSPHVINTAMSLFLRNRNSYDELRNSGLLALPCPRVLRSLGKELKVGEGGDPLIYSMFKEEIQQRKGDNLDDIVGHLMLDEVKLKNGISYNCNSNEVTGFLPKRLDTKNVYQDILDQSDKSVGDEPTKKKTVYANQWRFRSTRNLVHNADFFFNDGSLDGNELIRQMIQVVLSYEFIVVKIFGIVSDAGGGNSKMFRLLQGHHTIKGPWPDAKCLSFVNPVDRDRNIYIWSCGTHSFKAMRNNIYRSQLNKAKAFTSNGVQFGWGEIVKTYDRDMIRLKDIGAQRTDLSKHCVFLDNFTIMNASYAKKCFSEKTISEIISHVSVCMNVTLDFGMSFKSLWHKFMYYCNVLKLAKTSTTPLEMQSYIALLEYLISVHGIYIERLMNKKWSLNKSNIEDEKAILKHAIRYFTEWKHQRVSVMTRFQMNRKDTDQFFIADQTFENMLQCVGGFLAYSEAILGLPNSTNVFYIPGLHSNQSSLEIFFSRMRQLGKDRTDLYAGGVLQQNVMNDIKASNKKRKVGNCSYPEWQLNKEHLPIRIETRIGQDATNKRTEIRDIIDKAFDTFSVDANNGSIVSSNFASIGSAFGTIFIDEIIALSLPDGMNYQTYCLSDTFFQGYYSLSLNDTTQNWFTSFKDEVNKEEIVVLCKILSKELFHLFERSLMEHNKNRVSFQLNILQFLQKNGIERVLKSSSPTFNKNSRCLLILFMFLSKKLVDNWLPDLIQKHKSKLLVTLPKISNKTNPYIDGEVNRIVGWALYATIVKYEKLLKKTSDGKFDLVKDKLMMLQDIKATESEILQDHEYIKRYYLIDDAIRNKGSLTLIARPYINELSILSRFLSEKYNSSENLRATNQNVKIGVMKEITDGSHLSYMNSLIQTSNMRVVSTVLKNEERLGIFLEILNRVSNAKIGRTVRQYRTNHLTRVNDVKFRTQLSVLSAKKEKVIKDV